MNLQESMRQLGRLSGLPKWNEIEPDGKKELARQMASAFRSEKTASEAIDKWLKTSQWPPTPADLWALSKEFREEPEIRPDRECKACCGSGWKQCWMRVSDGKTELLLEPTGSPERNIYEAVTACHCDYGRFLEQKRASVSR